MLKINAGRGRRRWPKPVQKSKSVLKWRLGAGAAIGERPDLNDSHQRHNGMNRYEPIFRLASSPIDCRAALGLVNGPLDKNQRCESESGWAL